MEDLSWFRQAWETHVRRFHHGLAPDVLVGGMPKYCVPRVSRMIEPARDPGEAWGILESYFDRQTRILDELISDILSHERMVNDSQTLAHYSRILMAIREAKELGESVVLPGHWRHQRTRNTDAQIVAGWVFGFPSICMIP